MVTECSLKSSKTVAFAEERVEVKNYYYTENHNLRSLRSNQKLIYRNNKLNVNRFGD